IRFFVPLVTPENTPGLVVLETFVALTEVWEEEPQPNQLLFDDSSARVARGANEVRATESNNRKIIFTGRAPDEGTPARTGPRTKLIRFHEMRRGESQKSPPTSRGIREQIRPRHFWQSGTTTGEK